MPLPPHIRTVVEELVSRTFASIRNAVDEGAKGDALYDCVKKQVSFEILDDLVYALMDRLRTEGLLAPCANAGDRDIDTVNFWNTFVDAGLDPADPEFERHKATLSIMHLRRLGGILRGEYMPGPIHETATKVAAHRSVADTEQAFVDFLVEGNVNRETAGRGLVDCPITGQRLAIELKDWEMVLVDRKTGVPVIELRSDAPAPGI